MAGAARPATAAEPCAANGYLDSHVARLAASLRRWSGRELIPAAVGPSAAARGRWLYEAPFAVLSHGIGADPPFTYANRTAQSLFEATWAELVGLPSRLSAEPPERTARSELLAAVARDGVIDDYSGVRISRRGRRFRIERATVWTVVDERGEVCGQAALFSHWTPLPTSSA